MTIQLSADHATWTSETKVQEVSRNFLNTLGLSYFQYLRCFADGSIGLLTNDTNLIEQFPKMGNTPLVFSSFEQQHENTHSYWFLWDEALPKMPVEFAREKCHIHNGLTLVRRSKNYYDMIAFALPHELAHPASFYLSKLRSIEQFVNEFDADNQDLIQIMNKNPIALPQGNRDINYQKICLSKGQIAVRGKYGKTYITTQELACLRLLLQGATYKKIAQTLQISPRTVETYMLRVRQRSDFCTREEIESMMSV